MDGVLHTMAGVITGVLTLTIAIGVTLITTVEVMATDIMAETIMETDARHQEEVILHSMDLDLMELG